ncbi:MAG: radical SAM protein [Syntrophales bacterium]
MKSIKKDNSRSTNVYHITYSKQHSVGCLYFWGCNLRCKLCLLKKEAFDCHLPETRLRIYDPSYESERPTRFLTLRKLMLLLDPLSLKQIVLMGAEPVCDPILPPILASLKQSKDCSFVLLTNGRKFPPLSMVDDVIFSIKAVTPALHRDYTGVDNKITLRNFTKIAAAKSVSLHVETVFIPDYVDDDEVLRIADFVASVDPEIPFRIDAYLPIQGLPWRAPQAREIQSLAEKVRYILPNTSCLYGDGGRSELAYEVEKIF